MKSWKQRNVAKYHLSKPCSICSLKQYEWQALSDLLHQGIPFCDAFMLVKEDCDITTYFEQGMSVEEVLLKGHSGKFYEHLHFFLNITGLADAIDAALQMKGFEQSMRKKLIKQTSYPLLIFLMAFVTLYFFSMFIIPQLMQSFDMEEGNQTLLYFTSWLKYIAVILLVLLLAIGVLIIFCLRNVPLRLWAGNQLLRFTSLPADACSYTLAGYLIQLQKQGIATNTSFQFLTKVQKDTWFYSCVQRIQTSLENGEAIDDALKEEMFINHALLKSWQIGVYSQQLATALKDYMKRQEEAWIRFIKKLSVIIQCSSYAFVALMVLLVYQIMLVPLQILETM